MSVTQFSEQASTFDCAGERLIAIASVPHEYAARGVVVVVGGPQYRVGSHRQFTLLCRKLAAHGIAAMRFDYRGMGDSEGSARSFDEVGDDLRAAIDHFLTQHRDVEEVVLWGLCDAASAALFYAQHDPRVTGLVLLNPWVRTAEGVARAYMKGYYTRRVVDPELWGKVLGGRFNFLEAGRSLFSNVIAATSRQASVKTTEEQSVPREESLPQRMLEGWRQFRGRILLILSGNDLTADEFRTLVAHDTGWQTALAESRVVRCDVPGANHTFSRAEWRERVEQATAQWAQSW
jgi:exosortase A-associated hydrolase 1